MQHYKIALNTAADDEHARRTARYHIIRLNATSQKGANAYIAVVPYNKQLSLPSDLFTLALRRTLGLQLLPSDVPQDLPCPACGDANLTDAHIQLCSSQNAQTTSRHNSICRFIIRVLHHLRRTAQAEEPTDQGKRRWDITTDPIVPHPTARLYLDVSVTSPVQNKYLHSNNTNHLLPLAAANDKVSEKLHKYAVDISHKAAGSIFTPLVLDSFGASHQHVRDFILSISQFADDLSFSNDTLHVRSEFINQFAQTLSVLIHHSTAVTIRSSITRIRRLLDAAHGLSHHTTPGPSFNT